MSSLGRLVPRAARSWLRSHGGPLGSIVAVRTTAPEFVLTYDDGPEPGDTESILSVLQDRGARATFFVLLTRTRKNPELLREVMAAGHEIALHGVDHRPISRMSYREVLSRTSDAKAELEDDIGRPVHWFRPPYGLQSLSSFRGVRAAGLEPVLWGPTALDSRPATTEERMQRVLRGAGRGAIVLSHDGYADVADGGRGGNHPGHDRGALATRVLDAYAELGLRANTVSGAIASGSATRGIWFRR
ncbi:polysaccharide deacetylase family protein [Planctomonas psychrotolerans]|uniref:polysaccharide deacetylase family protein n=1 Tax=Planctomonas psychrotolerans TaxID=2528712 RepID=UPI001D0D6A50|nr:polysaccharide deacetylase family protein [Planctomonas psychrotolerans]